MIEEEKLSHAEHQKEREAEIEFLKMIIEEVIKHKGKPMHELMDHVIEKFHNTENKLTEKWQTKMGKWKQGWAEFKSRGVRKNVKNFSLWLFTPERINNVIMLIFAITDLETPVYLTLETLEAFGITHLLLGGMDKSTKKMDKFYKRHPNATNKVGKQFVEFMIGKEGVIPLFLGDGAFDENDARKNRLEDEANIIEIVASVVKKKAAAGQIIGDLFKWLLEKVQDKGFYLQVLQRWNETMRKLHEKLKNTNILKEAIEKNKEDEKEEENGGGKKEEEKEKKEVQNVVAKIENREIVKGPYCIKTLFQAIFIWIKAIGKKNELTINGVNHNQFRELVNKNMAHIVEKNAPKNEDAIVTVKKESKSSVNHTVAGNGNGNHSPRNVANGNGFRKERQ